MNTIKNNKKNRCTGGGDGWDLIQYKIKLYGDYIKENINNQYINYDLNIYKELVIIYNNLKYQSQEKIFEYLFYNNYISIIKYNDFKMIMQPNKNLNMKIKTILKIIIKMMGCNQND